MSELKISKEKHKINETLAVIATGFTVLYLIFRFVGESKDHPWMLFTAAGVVILGLGIPALGYWIHFGWYKLAEGMGFVMSRVMLTIVFFLVVFPMGFLARIMTRKDLLKFKKRNDSYYNERNHLYEPKDMENIW